ncbi:MAG: hypothetical protein HUU56_04825 [Bdellovibrionaceae bacterium]|nr:hypothetical protein [Pseudobdellovibrionaceae bacterium]
MQQFDKLKSSIVFKFVILKMLIFTPYVYAVPKVTTVGHTKGYVIKDISSSQVTTLLGTGEIMLSTNAKSVLAADLSYARMLGPDLAIRTHSRELGKNLYSYRYKDPKSNEFVVINDISNDGSLNRFTFPLSPIGEPVTEMTNLAVRADEATKALLLNIKTKTASYRIKLIEINGKYFRQINQKFRTLTQNNTPGDYTFNDDAAIIHRDSPQSYNFKNIFKNGEQIIDIKPGTDSHTVYSVDSKGQVFSYMIRENIDIHNFNPEVIYKAKVTDAMARKLGLLISHSQYEPKGKPITKEVVIDKGDMNYGVSIGNDLAPTALDKAAK